MYLIDLHVHYKRLRRHIETFEEAQCEAAVNMGLHAIMFTEHYEQLFDDRIAELNKRFAPLVVYSGVEVPAGGWDVLVVPPKGFEPELHAKRDSYETFVAFCRDKQWWTCLAHPFRKGRPMPASFAECPTDAIEIRSRNTPKEAEQSIRAIANAKKLSVLANSDAHKPRHVGAYCNMGCVVPRNNEELNRMLLAQAVFPY